MVKREAAHFGRKELLQLCLSVHEHLVGLLVRKGAADLCAYSTVLICVLQCMSRSVSLLIKTQQ